MSAQPYPILIAGGGIGGLATALALAGRGIASRVLERDAAPSEAGAGIQIGPNGMRVLDALGVAARLESVACAPQSIRVFDGPTGRLLTNLPLGSWIEDRHGAPYRTFHRADLRAALLARAAGEPLVEISAPFEAADVAQDADGARVSAKSGETVRGQGLVGADGLWSRVRRAVAPAGPGRARRAAARALIEADRAPPIFAAPSIGVWLAPGAHVVHYPVRAGRLVAAVVVFEEEGVASSWDTACPAGEAARRVAGFAPELRGFIGRFDGWRKWPLFEPAPLPRWSNGRVTLLGDAAHPVLPFFAQGGVLALEDAVTLADCVARHGADIPAAFAAYERTRRPRAARVQAASRHNGWIYHLSGAMALARNAYLRARDPRKLIAAYDWLYGWRNSG